MTLETLLIAYKHTYLYSAAVCDCNPLSHLFELCTEADNCSAPPHHKHTPTANVQGEGLIREAEKTEQDRKKHQVFRARSVQHERDRK